MFEYSLVHKNQQGWTGVLQHVIYKVTHLLQRYGEPNKTA